MIANRFSDRDLVMRYHWGLAVGHVYTHQQKSSHRGVLWRNAADHFQGGDGDSQAPDALLAGDEGEEIYEGIDTPVLPTTRTAQDDVDLMEKHPGDEGLPLAGGEGDEGEEVEWEDIDEVINGEEPEPEDPSEEADGQLLAMDEMYGSPDSADELDDD